MSLCRDLPCLPGENLCGPPAAPTLPALRALWGNCPPCTKLLRRGGGPWPVIKGEQPAAGTAPQAMRQR